MNQTESAFQPTLSGLELLAWELIPRWAIGLTENGARSQPPASGDRH